MTLTEYLRALSTAIASRGGVFRFDADETPRHDDYVITLIDARRLAETIIRV